jgi:DNA-binding MarR family transcriptional regulator
MPIVSFKTVAFDVTDLMKRILKVIKQNGEASPTEIANKITDVAQSTISRNLQQLELADLIVINGINGKEKLCKLTPEGRIALRKFEENPRAFAYV